MKLNKIYFLMSLIYFLFTSISVSQTEQFEELMENDFLKSELRCGVELIDKYNFMKIHSTSSSTNGSPFNNKDNTQIDSVVITKVISSTEDEIIKYFYTYDSSGNVATEEKENYWEISNTYDANGNLTLYVSRRWENGQWINAQHLTTIYDSIGNRTFALVLHWDDTSWVNNAQGNYYYNSHGDLTSYLEKGWDGAKWVNSFRKTNTYDSNYYLVSSLFQNWGGSDWTGHSWRNNYTYDSNGNEIIQLREVLNINKWENSSLFTYEYDKKDNQITYLYEVWTDGEWISRFRYFFTYDNNRNRIFTKEETWREIKWVNALQQIYSYNTNGDLSYATTEIWWDNSWIPRNGTFWMYDIDGNSRHYFGREVVIYYASLTDIKDEELLVENYSLSQNYPNPFNPSTIIRYTIPKNVRGESQEVRLTIYDILGREVALLIDKEQSTGSYEVEFNASSLTSGIYFYRLKVSNGSTINFCKTKKLVLLK